MMVPRNIYYISEKRTNCIKYFKEKQNVKDS